MKSRAALWCVYGVALCGRWLHGFALSWFVFDRTQSAASLALVAALSSLPILLLAPVAERLGRMVEPHRILMATQVAAALLAAVTALLAQSSALDWPTLLAIAAAFGMVTAIDAPTSQAWLIDATGNRGLASTIARQSLAFNATRMVAPALATALTVKLGVVSCFAANAAACLPLLFFIAMSPPRPRGTQVDGAAAEPDRPRFSSLRPVLRPLVLVASFSLLGLPVVGILPAISAAVLGPGVTSFGMLAAAVGIGAFVASLGFAMDASLLDQPRLGSSSAALFAAAGFALAAPLPAWAHCALAVVQGACIGVFLTSSNHCLQARATRATRELVTSLYTGLLVGLPAVGSLALGTLADAFGVLAVVTVDCVLLAAAALVAAASRSRSPVLAQGAVQSSQS